VILPVLLAAAAAASLSFEGISLGDDINKIVAAHAGHATLTALGPAWTWRRSDGGAMMVAGDKNGKVALVDFVTDEGEDGDIALPGTKTFRIQGTHTDLAQALDESSATECALNYSSGFCGAFPLPGGTELVTQFESNDGQLHRATWASPETLSKLLILPPVVPLAT
jgi:hypothetical protein